MFVSKIDKSSKYNSFKGYQRDVNEYGEKTLKFYYPYNYSDLNAEIEFYKVKKEQQPEFLEEGIPKGVDLPTYYACRHHFYSMPINKDGNSEISLNKLREKAKIGENEPIAYKVVLRDKDNNIVWHGKDSGLGVSVAGTDSFATFLPTNIGSIKGLGAGVLVMPKVHRPGVYRDPVTQEIVEDPELQLAAEKTITHFSSNPGGGLVGIIYDLDLISEVANVVFLNPFAGADNKSHHGYWNKNNKQISDDMGNVNDFNELARGLFRRGMTMVNDGTFTSEGLEGVHFQYALRWAGHGAQPYYWFRMGGLKNAPISLGVIPNNKENVSHRVINPTHVYDPETKKVVANKDYDATKETLIQLYDKTLVTDEQLSELDEPIDRYRKLKEGSYTDINSHNDTVINYIFAVQPKEYEARLREFVKYNKTEEEPMDLYSPEGTIFIGQFSNFKFGYKKDGGIFVWYANTDMVKMSYFLSPYDELSVLSNITDPVERDVVRKKMRIGTYQVRDMAVQAGQYWTQKYSDAVNLDIVKSIGYKTTEQELQALADSRMLPQDSVLSQDALDNLEDGLYELSPKQKLTRDDYTTKSLMKLPLDTLELSDKTVGILASPYMSNLATDPSYIGKSRFSLYKEGNPQLLKENKSVYSKVDDLYAKEIKVFADKVIESINEKSDEKLVDESGEYTIYGEYVVNLLGQEIAKYALLKGIMRDKLEPIITNDSGELKYNYVEQRKISNPEAFGIHGITPEDEANQLVNYITKGVRNLSADDVEFVSSVLSKQIEGTNEMSFKIAEAMLAKTQLILPWRLDAAKDMVDMDAVRNRKMTFDEAWDNVVAFWKEFSDGIKEINPNAVIVAEITNVEELVSHVAGLCAFDNSESGKTTNLHKLGVKYASQSDAVNALMNAGITTEAAYSYTFTDFHEIVANHPEKGSSWNHIKDDKLINVQKKLAQLRDHKTQDFLRFLYTFMDNHDKPSELFNNAINLELYFANLAANPTHENPGLIWRRSEAMVQLNNCDNPGDLPAEVLLNLKNPEYFRSISSKAVAVSELMRNCINVLGSDIATETEKALMKEALVDLINGNYLGEGKTVNYQTINIKELSSFEQALYAIATDAGCYLDGREKPLLEFIKSNPIKSGSVIEKHMINGDINDPNNKAMMQYILQEKSQSEDYSSYSLYAATLAVIVMDAIIAKREMFSDVEFNNFKNAATKFVKHYSRSLVEANRMPLPVREEYKDTMKKEGFGAADFRHSIEMVLNQAKYKAEQKQNLNASDLFKDTNKIFAQMFKEATEASVEKTLIYASILAAFPGVPTTFLRDIYLGLGFDYKTKNEFVRSRGVTNISDTVGGPVKDYVKSVKARFEEVMAWRKKPELSPLNDGTPYLITGQDGGWIDVKTKIKDAEFERNAHVVSYLVQGADGKIVIPLITNEGINPYYWVNYSEQTQVNKRIPKLKDIDINKIVLPYNLKLADGTLFEYDEAGKKVKCILKNFGDRSEIFRAVFDSAKNKYVPDFSKNIQMTSKTMKNGVMFLTKCLSFKGNSPFNPALNLYQKPNNVENGKNLSIIAG